MTRTNPELELRSTRTLHAPPELVYRAMTEPAEIQRWWGPAGFRTTTESFDLRPGGVWRLTMHAPDGRDFHNRIVFDELEPPRRIVYRHEPVEGTEPVAFQVTVELEPRGRETALTMTFRFATPELRRLVVETYGAERGNKETLNRLDAHLHSRQHPMDFSLEAAGPSFRSVRDFAAPIDLVWAALTEPARLAQWWGGAGVPGRTEVRAMDVRPGGEWLVVEHAEDGGAYPFRGTFREVTPKTRLVYTMRMDEGEWREREALVTGILEPVAGGTRLTTTSTFTSPTVRQQWVDAGAESGGRQHFDHLADYLANAPPTG
jgi:uncharacterized protein YndB with AHSA1/START domain